MVTVQVAFLEPAFAVIFTVPAFLAVTVPFDTVAFFLSLVPHVIVLLEAVDGDTVAFNFFFSPTFMVSFVLSSFTEETSVVTVTLHLAVTEPAFAVMLAVPLAFPVTLPF